MRLFQPDHPRRIDGIIDYFGEPLASRHLTMAGVPDRLPRRAPAVVPRAWPARGRMGGPVSRSSIAKAMAVSMSVLLFAVGCAKRPAVTEVSAPAPTGQAAMSEPVTREPAVTAPVAPEPAPAVVGAAPQAEPAPRVAAPAAPAAPSAPAVAPAPPRPAPPAAYEPVAELADIHFDFDRSEIRPGDARILERNAEWLLANRDYLVLIEGHCDERGTNEYNMALGERRAQATREFLIARGVAPARMMTLSYGEERPQCAERNEACWSKNRRSHFLAKRG
jgi:peptidoglycan-associated lipoprotein